MKAVEIRTEKDLKTWLGSQPFLISVSIAHRAVARAFPLLWRSALSSRRPDGELLFLSLRSLIYSNQWFLHSDPYVGGRFGWVIQTVDWNIILPGAASDRRFDKLLEATSISISSPDSDIQTDVIKGVDLAQQILPQSFLEAQRDAVVYEEKGHLSELPLWNTVVPAEVADAWQKVLEFQTSATDDQPDYRSFWVPWYQGLLDGKPAFPDSLIRAVALIDPEDWDKGDLHINNVVIPRLMAEHMPHLLEAAPVDFSFDAFARVMRMVGIDDDTAHLRDPALVTSFRDDCEEVEDTLQDFRDYAQTLSGGGNHAAVLALSVDKVMKELRRTGEKTHLRARYLVGLCRDLEVFSKEEKAREDLGKALATKLDSGISLLQTVTRKHLAPAYTALLPLSQLSVDHVDQDAVVSLYDEMIEWLEHLPDATPVPLDEDGLSVFRDMVREVRDLRAAIAEASSDEFRTMLEGRFAASAGGVGLAVGRLVQRSSVAAGVAGRGADATIRNFERARSLKDIFDAVWALLPGNPP